MISNCGHDENNNYHGGKAGDQTGGEWKIIPWYNRPWTCVLRHPNAEVRNMIAKEATDAANNNNIGYDQWERLTFFNEYSKVGFVASKITTPCETDCSQGTTSIVIGVGNRLNDEKLKKIDPKTYTGNMKANFKAAGFSVLTAKKYLTSDAYLVPGDVLLYSDGDKGHAAINVTANTVESAPIQNETPKKSASDIAKEVVAGKWGNGEERKKKLTAAGYNYDEIQKIVNTLVAPSKTTVTKYRVNTVSTNLNVRSTPNGTIVGSVAKGSILEVVSISNGWAKLSNGKYVSANYIVKV